MTSKPYREFKNSAKPHYTPTNVNPLQFVDKPLTNSTNKTQFALYINSVKENWCRDLSLMMQNQSYTFFTNEELQDLQS